MNLNSPIREIKGMGVKTEQLFQQLGVYTVGDILLYFPSDNEKIPAYSEVEQIFEDRKNLYRKYADITFNLKGKSIRESVDDIYDNLINKDSNYLYIATKTNLFYT